MKKKPLKYNIMHNMTNPIFIFITVSPHHPETNIQVFQGKENHKPYATLQ